MVVWSKQIRCGMGGLEGRNAPHPPQVGDLDCFVKRGGQLLTSNDNRNTPDTTFSLNLHPTSRALRAETVELETAEDNLQEPTADKQNRLVHLSNMASRSTNTQTGMGASRQSMATSGSAVKARQLVCLDPFFPTGQAAVGDKHATRFSTLARVRSRFPGGTLTTPLNWLA